jgi:hypothetical protein
MTTLNSKALREVAARLSSETAAKSEPMPKEKQSAFIAQVDKAVSDKIDSLAKKFVSLSREGMSEEVEELKRMVISGVGGYTAKGVLKSIKDSELSLDSNPHGRASFGVLFLMGQ